MTVPTSSTFGFLGALTQWLHRPQPQGAGPSEPLVYSERLHPLGLVVSLIRPLVGLAVILGLCAQSNLGDAGSVRLRLVAMGVVALAALWLTNSRTNQGLRRPWRRVAWSVVLVAAVGIYDQTLLGVAGLIALIVALYLVLRAVALWHSRRVVVTDTYVGICARPPRWTFSNYRDPSAPIIKVTTVEVDRPWWMPGVRCGHMLIDTSGQEDATFHFLPFVRDPERVRHEILEASARPARLQTAVAAEALQEQQRTNALLESLIHPVVPLPFT